MTPTNLLYESPVPLYAQQSVAVNEDQLWTNFPDAKLRHTEQRGRSPASASVCSASSGTLVDDDQSSLSARGEPDLPKGNPWVQDRAERARREFLLALVRKARQHSPSPVPSRPLFNPYAAPFQPAAARAAAAPAPASPTPAPVPVPPSLSQRTSALAVKPPWISTFRAGSVSGDRVVRRTYAQAVASAGWWDADALGLLAAKFVQRATEGYGPQLASVAPFARAVYDALAENDVEGGKRIAERFRMAIVYVVSQEFDAWWQSGAPTAIANSALEKTQSFLASALAIATFVAHLFVEGLIPRAYVLQCLQILVGDMRVIEEVHAVHAIVSHASAALCENVQEMAAFMHTFTARAAAIPDGASALGQMFNQAEVQAWVQEICQLVKEWCRSQVATSPRPAAASNVPPGLGYDNPRTPTAASSWTVRAPHRTRRAQVFRTYSEVAKMHT